MEEEEAVELAQGAHHLPDQYHVKTLIFTEPVSLILVKVLRWPSLLKAINNVSVGNFLTEHPFQFRKTLKRAGLKWRRLLSFSVLSFVK